MQRPEIRAKVSATHKERGITFLVRGGNGTGMTKQQAALLQELVRLRPSWLWSPEHAVSNGRRKKGYPTNYKVDIASIKHRFAVEIDGNSHKQLLRKGQDEKKDTALALQGWRVLRLSNEEIDKSVNLAAMFAIKMFTPFLQKPVTISQTVYS